MTESLRLRVHVAEPFDFERENASPDLLGITHDHMRDSDEWLVDLDAWFTFNESDYDTVLIAPRYVGEHLGKVHDALLGVPIRIAHRAPGGWHFAMTGMLSLAPPAEPTTGQTPPEEEDHV